MTALMKKKYYRQTIYDTESHRLSVKNTSETLSRMFWKENVTNKQTNPTTPSEGGLF